METEDAGTVLDHSDLKAFYHIWLPIINYSVYVKISLTNHVFELIKSKEFLPFNQSCEVMLNAY